MISSADRNSTGTLGTHARRLTQRVSSDSRWAFSFHLVSNSANSFVKRFIKTFKMNEHCHFFLS